VIRAGDMVEILSAEEILQTLDKNGRLDGMPFMPQMFKYCGQKVKVYKSAYKTCDTVSGRYIGLSVKDAVHLSHRCDGEAYEGCQAACLIFWKEAWLKPVAGTEADRGRPAQTNPMMTSANGVCTQRDVSANISVQLGGETVYKCQATTLLEYTRPLKWWDARQYVAAYSSGNKSLSEILRGLTFLAYSYGTRAHSVRFGGIQRWLYDRARGLWGGIPFPRRWGSLPPGVKSPRTDLDLVPGELVRVKSYEEILATLDHDYGHRGMKFDAELIPYCGKTFRVRTQVHKFVDETTGKMRTLKTPAVILDGVVCQSKYAGQRMFCPREIYCWWRESWLERVEQPVRHAATNVHSTADAGS
jgi:hypothetical protein